MTDEQYDPKILITLAEFVADQKPCLIGSDPPLNLRTLASELRFLPVMLDGGGCVGLLLSGEAASFLWNEPRFLRAELDPRIRNMTRFQASLKYPALASLAPIRPIDAKTCEPCGGTGQCLELPLKFAEHLICYCGGLGWLPANNASNGH